MYSLKKIKILTQLMVGVIVFSLLAFSYVSAQTEDELRSKIQESSNEIGSLEDEINQYKAQLIDIGKEANTLKNTIKEIEVTRKKLKTDIKITEGKVYSKNIEIQGLGLQIEDKNTIIRRNMNGIGESMRRINEFDSSSMLELILSNNKVSDVWSDIDNIESFQKKTREYVVELRSVRKELRGNKEETEEAKEELQKLKSNLSDKKTIVEHNKKEKNTLLKQTKNEESKYKNLLEEKRAKKKAFEKALEEFESQLQFILDPNALPGGGSLSWPLDYVFITQRFGKTVSSKRLYASGTHSGVDFRASTGTELKAMASGMVIGTGDTDKTCKNASWGKWITIKYDNGLASTYGHLSLIKSTLGQRVSRGQVVGYTGNTGHSTAPHLHTTVYAGDAVQISQKPSAACSGKTYTIPLAARNAYLDPLEYLPATTPDMFKHAHVSIR